MTWIEAFKELPKAYETVLLVMGGKVNVGYYRPSKGFYELIDGGVAFENLVTHWMPLPEPPKED